MGMGQAVTQSNSQLGNPLLNRTCNQIELLVFSDRSQSFNL